MCSGPGAMSSGPGAMSSGPGAMSSGPGAMCSGPGAMSSGPGAFSCGPGGMSYGPGQQQFELAQTDAYGNKLTFNGPTCAVCGKPVIGKVFSVSERSYHPECFKCHNCDRRISETESFMEQSGEIYCEDCFNQLFGERCFACQQPVIGQCIRFRDRIYHPNHFTCAECGQSLLGVQHKEDEGDPLCLKCKAIRVKIRDTKHEICAKCKKPILGEYIIVNGQKIHPEHYRCESCGCEFTGGNCKEHDGKNYCYACFDKLVKSVCAGCGKPIIGRSITALMRSWHPECLKCSVCGETFVQGKYFEHDGKAYCEFHYFKLFGKICPRCQKVVDDEGIVALGQTWHVACFTCHGCSKPLKGDVYDYESKPLCKSCFKKLPKNVRKALEDKLIAKQKAEEAEKKRLKAEQKAREKAEKEAAKRKI